MSSIDDGNTAWRRRPLAAALATGLMFAVAGGLSACGEDSEQEASDAAEEAGEAVEEMTEDAKDAVEEAGDKVEEATDEAAE